MRRALTLQRASVLAVLLAGAAVMLMPLAWMLLTSLKPFDELFASPPRWLPRHLRWANYRDALTSFQFLLYLRNSVLVTTVVILGTLASCSMAAYGFSFLRAPGRDLVFYGVLSTLMLPGQITIIPVFQFFTRLGWINTWLPLTLPAWLGANAFAIFLLRQFFRSLPRDYVDAARMDGASEPRILWSVFVPLSRPALLTVGVFTFIGAWNDLWGPLIFLHDERLYTLPIALINFVGMTGTAQGTPWNLLMAASTVMMLPIVVLFFLAQRRFIEGISMTGIKA